MNELTNKHARRASRRNSGFTLVELMVAIAVALFLLGGLFASLQSTRKAYGNQNLLAQLQDNQRLAMTLLAEVVETTGYYPNPVTNTATAVLSPDALFATAGQAIVGAANPAGPGDMITVRYAPALNDNAYSCIGTQNTATAPYAIFENTFQVINNQLVCTFNGTQYPLITSNVNGAGVTILGVQNMTLLYGVKSNLADTGSCTDTYLTAAQVTAGNYWNSVCSVTVTLTFINPITPTGPGISISRVIALMSTAGVNS